MNGDEVTDAFGSYSMVHFGIDMNGYKNPVVKVNYGEVNDAWIRQ